MRKFVVSLEGRNTDPSKSIYRITYGKEAKDLDGKDIYLPDDKEMVTLGDLTALQNELQAKIDETEEKIQAIIKLQDAISEKTASIIAAKEGVK